MSGIRDDRGGAPRRYRLAGAGSPEVGLEHHIDDLAAAFALGALDGDERAAVERHARLCDDCAALLDRECRVVALLPLAVPPAQPAPDVKLALFARIAQAQGAAAEANLPSHHARTLPPTMTIPSSRPATAVEAPAVTLPQPWRDEPAERRSWLGRAGAVASVPLLLALIATGAWGLQQRNQVADGVGEVSALQANLANFGAGTALPLYEPSSAARGGELLVGFDDRQGMVKMTLDPDPAREYRLIAMDTEGKVIPVADLEVDDQGTSQVFSFDQPFDSYQKVQVRAEAVSGGAGEAVPLLFGDINGSIGAGDGTSNNAAP